MGDPAPQLFGPSERPVQPYSLVRLSSEVARRLAPIGRVAVEGECHRPKAYGSTTFFTLKDRAASVTVCVPARAARRSRTMHGERVRVTGSLVWQADRGQVQLSAEEVVPVGAGAVAAMVAAARERLRAEGLLDRPRRPLPLLPRAIGVVCGAEASVLHDIRSVVDSRFPGYPLRVRTCRVSGPGAASGIEAAIADLAADPEVEVVVVARGGGGPGELLPFSDEQVCRAVAAARVPVAVAIGHEDDRPLVDEVADARFGTPSLAAAAVVPHRAALAALLDDRLERAGRHLRDRAASGERRLSVADPAGALGAGLRLAEDRLSRGGRRLAAAHPAAALAGAHHRLERASTSGRAGARLRLERAGGRLAVLAHRLGDLGPHAVLDRGYALVRDPAGRVVRDPAVLAPGQRVVVEVAGGRFTALVESVDAADAVDGVVDAVEVAGGAGDDRG